MISVAALRALVAAGMSASAIVDAIEADQAESEISAIDRRRKERERKRAYRMSQVSRGTDGTSRDNTGQNQAVVQPQPTVNTTACVQQAKEEASDETRCLSLSSLLPSDESSEERKKDSGVARARAKGATATRLPDDWQPDLEFARTILPEDAIDLEVEKFRDHWRAANGPPSLKRDWHAAWRNWCRKAPQFNGRANGRQQSDKSVLSAFDRLTEQLTSGSDNEGGEGGVFRLSS